MKSNQFHTNDWKGKDTFPYSAHFSAITESVSVLFFLRSQNNLKYKNKHTSTWGAERKCKNKHTSTWVAERKTPLEGTRILRIHTAI
jgi:hypothetical protein